MRRFLIIFILLVAILVTALTFLRGALSRPLVFPAPRMRLEPHLPGGRLLKVQGERTTYGYYAANGKKLVVLFHGNGEVMGSMQDLARVFQDAGFSTLMAEYPGYGYAAQGSVSEDHIYADVSLLLGHVAREFGHAPQDTVLFGFSLGTGVAVEMALRQLGHRLILLAPFTSAGDAAEHHLGKWARWLLVDHFDNKTKAPQIHYPVMILHGERDSVLPFRMGREMAQLFPQAEFIPVYRADHNDLFLYIDKSVWQRILRFAGAAQ